MKRLATATAACSLSLSCRDRARQQLRVGNSKRVYYISMRQRMHEHAAPASLSLTTHALHLGQTLAIFH